jgi:hypothetical protein
MSDDELEQIGSIYRRKPKPKAQPFKEFLEKLEAFVGLAIVAVIAIAAISSCVPH